MGVAKDQIPKGPTNCCLDLLHHDHRIEKLYQNEERRSKNRVIFGRSLRSLQGGLLLLKHLIRISSVVIGNKKGKRALFVLSLLRFIAPPPDFFLFSI